MFDTVVLATDGSPSVARAVTFALDIGERFGADLHVLYVVDDDEIEAVPEDEREAVRADLRSEGERALTDVTDRRPDATTALREGDPAEELCEYADSVGADLLVMGTRGRHGDYGFLLGSVAEAVVRRSPAPVLTARQLEPRTDGDPATAGTD